MLSVHPLTNCEPALGKPWALRFCMVSSITLLCRLYSPIYPAHWMGRPAVMAKGEPGRNDPCSCGSGRKYKKCCWGRGSARSRNPIRHVPNGPLPPPSRLYKYLTPDIAKTVMGNATFRIGTLHEYQNIEQYAGAQGDAHEGHMEVQSMIVGFKGGTGQELPAQVHTSFNSPNVTMDGVIIRNRYQSPNCYIFCCSTEWDKEILNRPQYGSGIIINNPNLFCASLTNELRKLRKIQPIERDPDDSFLLRYAVGARIEYRNRKKAIMYFDGKNHDAHPMPWIYVKPKEFQDDHEWRFAWNPTEPPGPLIIKCEEALSHCELLDT